MTPEPEVDADTDVLELGERAVGHAWPDLTARQLQIARLVAEGLKNREIAEELWLSSRTVDCHVARIYARVGVSTRVQLANALANGTQPDGDEEPLRCACRRRNAVRLIVIGDDAGRTERAVCVPCAAREADHVTRHNPGTQVRLYRINPLTLAQKNAASTAAEPDEEEGQEEIR